MKDCIIIGKGPAGLSAALYIRRAGFEPLVIGKDSGALGQSHRIENYFGLEHPISGDELFRRGLNQVKQMGIEVLSDEVVSIRETEDFRVNTASGLIISTKSILLATGKHRTVSIPNAADFFGCGVSRCAVCDGFLMRNRSLAVIGSGDQAVAELSHLRQLTNHIELFTNGATITTDRFPRDLPIHTERILNFTAMRPARLLASAPNRATIRWTAHSLQRALHPLRISRCVWVQLWTTAISRSTANIKPMSPVCMPQATASAVFCRSQRPCQMVRLPR